MTRNKQQNIASTIGIWILVSFLLLILVFVPSQVGQGLLLVWFVMMNVLLHPRFRRWLISKLTEVDRELTSDDILDMDEEEADST